MKIVYATLGTNDPETSVAYYTELLASVGVTPLYDNPRGGRLFGKDGVPVLGIIRPFDGEAASVGNGSMLSLELQSHEEVDAFYAKALALGGSDEGAPGERGPGYYMSYFRDLEGNKLCACKLGDAA